MKKRGFTLLEVMVALAVIVVMATALFGVQMALMRATSKATMTFTRLWRMVDFLRKTEIKFTLPKTDFFQERRATVNPDIEIVCTLQKLPKNSILSEYKDLFIQKVTANWGTTKQGKKSSDVLISFMYRPKPKNTKSGDTGNDNAKDANTTDTTISTKHE